jgi:hypothetical protein
MTTHPKPQQSAEEELRLEEEISEALTALENSVERITAARLYGRTSSNRMVHGKFVTALLDIFQAYTARKVLEAEKRTHHIYKKEMDYWKGMTENFIKREQLKMPEPLYTCDNSICSQLHTANELASLNDKEPK